MKSYQPEQKRVVGFFGHRGAGKTSLIEASLYTAKATTRLGSVDSGTLHLESDQEALERRTTMASNVGFAEWNNVRIGIIDNPGDSNFWGSTKRVAQVVDAAIVCVAATDGLEPGTMQAIEALRARNVPFAIFISKLDKEGCEYANVMEEIKSDISSNAAPVSLPIEPGLGFKGVVSLIANKAYASAGDTENEIEIPGGMSGEVESAREQLIDAVAAADDALMEKYLEEGSLSEAELSSGLKAAFLRGDLVPVLAGVPTANVGTTAALDLIASSFPSPLERGAIKGHRRPGSEETVERNPDPAAPLVAQVFRTHYDPFAGNLAYARVYAGTVKASTDVYNATSEQGDRPSHLYIPQGGTKNGVEVKEATVGDLVALTKLKACATGHTLSAKDDPLYLPEFQEPPALLNFGIGAASTKEEDKLAQYVTKIIEEDPSLRLERDPQTKEMLLGGLGQAHIDYVVARLKRMGIEPILKEPKVPYRETLKAPIMEIEGKHKKQSGGHGQFGVCYVNFEPKPRGEGFEFVDQIVGGSIPRQFISSVEKGLRDAMVKGPLSGHEVVDVRITLYDGKYHRVDSSDMAFQIAGRKAVKAAFNHPKAKPIILEPYMLMDIQCPADMVGDIMGDLNSRRGRVLNMETEGKRGKIKASVPMNEVLRYTNVLKSLTSGQGSFSMIFDKYEEAPADITADVRAAYKAEEEED